jgi:hypothetical protein
VDAIRYLAKEGIQWRAMPADLPHWRTVYDVADGCHKSGATRKMHRIAADGADHRRVQDRDGARAAAAEPAPRLSRSQAGWADGGYAGNSSPGADCRLISKQTPQLILSGVYLTR